MLDREGTVGSRFRARREALNRANVAISPDLNANGGWPTGWSTPCAVCIFVNEGEAVKLQSVGRPAVHKVAVPLRRSPQTKILETPNGGTKASLEV